MNKMSSKSFSSNLFGYKVTLQEKINFARHLSVMIRAGLPLLESLKIIRRQPLSKNLLHIIDKLMADVNNGQSLGSALDHFKYTFGDFFISIVMVGEASGTLADNLLYLAEEMNKSKELRNKVRSAMVYPAILFIMTIAVSGFLTFFVFPKILPTFANFDVKLPPTTRVLMAVLSYLKDYWWVLLIGIMILVVIVRLLLRFEIIRYMLHRVFLATPVVSSLSINVNMANFTRILAILLKSGVKIVEAMIIVSNTFENRVYRKSLGEAAEKIRKGESFSEHLMRNGKIFPPLLSAMIQVGENTGNLEDNLMYLSSYYNGEVDSSLKNLTTLLEPLILLIMGLLVGFVALSIITPIYSISQGLTK